MHQFRFKGKTPDVESAAERLEQVLRKFSSVRQWLIHASISELTEAQKRELSDQFEVDRFLVEDVFRATKGGIQPPIDPMLPGVFWTLGRAEPRWGMPWASVSFEDDRAFVHVRWAGSFDDLEDPPRTVRCEITFTGPEQRPEIERLLFESGRLDLWFQCIGEQLEGVLVAE
jgi:hypothetical protein